MQNKTPPPPHNHRAPWIWTHTHFNIFVLSIALLLTLFIGSILYIFVTLDIPDIRTLSGYKPPVTSIIYDDRETVIARIFLENRLVVPLAEMPPTLPKAFMAAEDSRFLVHQGVDAWSILRAFLHNVMAGDRSQGASTITQQVARSLLLSPEKTYVRKVKEAILAYRIDKALSKNEIMELYLNEIYFGEGAYGVAAAAQTYFGKSVSTLDLAEMAILAGLPQAPSRYSPFKHFAQAKRRQTYVLTRMVEEGFITAAAAEKAAKQVLLWGATADPTARSNKYFIEQVRSYVESKYGRETLMTGGLSIHTSLNQKMQKAADQALKKGVEEWQERQEAKLNREPPQAALLAMEVKTGWIKAMIGGTNFGNSQFNRAVQARRQPGSAFKPIIYATALARGLTPSTVIIDEPIRLPGPEPGKPWEPQNYDNTFTGATTLRNALVHSRNIVTIKILQQIGVDETVKMARQLGIASPLDANLSLALGTSGVSLKELTAAYTAFANNGMHSSPMLIRKIFDRNGKILEENRPVLHQAVDPGIAFQITQMLEGVIQEGTGKKAQGLPVPSAGKTGTTDKNTDAWFIGYTPLLATGVWYGFDQAKTLGKSETGGTTAAPVWLEFMRNANDYLKAAQFAIPAGMTPFKADSAETLKGEKEKSFWEIFR